jgi:hypothetical protein
VLSELHPFKARQYLEQCIFAEIDVRAMVAMMRECGMEITADEVMGTEEQFAEFERRWKTKLNQPGDER